MPKLMKVIAVSDNYNAFGLRNMIMVTSDGKGWQAAANDINLKLTGSVFKLPSKGDVGLFLSGMGMEIPSELPDPPPAVMKAAWAEEMSHKPNAS